MEALFLLFIAVLPVAVLVFWIYKKDRNKEPKKLLWKLFFGGFGSVLITLSLSGIFSFIPFFTLKEDATLFETFLHTFIAVALIEEFSKWIVMYKLAYKNPEFDEQYDGIVYSCLTSLGFACLENVLYVSSYGFMTGVMRAILAVPGHASDGIFMGHFVGLAKTSEQKQDGKEKKYLFLSLLTPIMLHGIYDFCVFSKNEIMMISFFVFIVVLYVVSIKRINKTSAIHQKIFYKDKFCPICGRKIDSDFCPNCGRKNC